MHFDGVQIELGDVRIFYEERRNVQQRGAERFKVHRLSSSSAGEQWKATEFSNHLIGVIGGDGTDSERDISHYLDIDAAESEHQRWSERRIVQAADDDFDAIVLIHFAHQHAVDSSVVIESARWR